MQLALSRFTAPSPNITPQTVNRAQVACPALRDTELYCSPCDSQRDYPAGSESPQAADGEAFASARCMNPAGDS